MTIIPVQEEKNLKDVSEKTKFLIFYLFAFLLGLTAFFFNSASEIWSGVWLIMRSPANLLTDYIELANPGAAFMNAALMTLEALLIVRYCKAKINGPVIAGILIITGFSFFGKNFYNSLPIILGAFYYAKVTRNPLKRSLLAALFGTALSPLVSEFSFSGDLPLPLGIFLGIPAGFLSGFLIPPLAAHVVTFTKGFSLYNVGFTCGLIGTVFISFLRNFRATVDPVSILASGYNFPFAIILFSLFVLTILIGLSFNNWSFKGMKAILQESGQLSTDYIDVGGIGAAFINMGVLGVFATAYILLLKGELNGPVLGGIFSVVGFGAFGKNIKNALPVMLGATGMSFLTYHDPQATDILIATLFVTTLSPIAGRYGSLAGIIAGALHLTLVVNIGFLHGGVNLYNNGFAGGLVAAIFVPFLEAIQVHRSSYKEMEIEVDPADEVEKS